MAELFSRRFGGGVAYSRAVFEARGPRRLPAAIPAACGMTADFEEVFATVAGPTTCDASRWAIEFGNYNAQSSIQHALQICTGVSMAQGASAECRSLIQPTPVYRDSLMSG